MNKKLQSNTFSPSFGRVPKVTLIKVTHWSFITKIVVPYIGKYNEKLNKNLCSFKKEINNEKWSYFYNFFSLSKLRSLLKQQLKYS
jgi:hypothetical protein